jgi:hypothetical protein
VLNIPTKHHMASSSSKTEVYLEIGKKRVFAGAIEWPGWCRSGRDEAAALQALFDYGTRYAHLLRPAGLGFTAPTSLSDFNVIERLKGGTTTDFGAPEAAPSNNKKSVDEAELQRLKLLLEAGWLAFDSAVRQAEGRQLRKGPRGGGRDLDGIIQHVLGADASYLQRIGRKLKQIEEGNWSDQLLEERRQAILNGLSAAVHGELPARGPRGGVYWTPRYFVRRVVWHVLDHAWEL